MLCSFFKLTRLKLNSHNSIKLYNIISSTSRLQVQWETESMRLSWQGFIGLVFIVTRSNEPSLNNSIFLLPYLALTLVHRQLAWLGIILLDFLST